MDQARKRATTDVARAQSATISVRANRHQIELIDQAARVLGTSRSAFVLQAACREAEVVLLDQTHFQLSENAYAAFTRLLDAPPEPTDALRKLLNNRAPWE